MSDRSSSGSVSAPINPFNSISADSLYERVGGKAGLKRLVEAFYTKARKQEVIGPIFEERIKTWPEHLAKITEFWCRVTGGPSDYMGGMGQHFFLEIGPEHIMAWLALWDENCRELLPEAEAREMSALAHNVGDDLQRMIARRPSVG